MNFFYIFTYILIGEKMHKKDKLYWLNDELLIENYQKIYEVLDDKIELEHFLIGGNRLQINQMDGYLIRIKGQILMIRRKNDEHL